VIPIRGNAGAPRLVALLLLAVAFAAGGARARAAGPRAPAAIAIAPPVSSAGWIVYRLRVARAVRSAIVVVPYDARIATLEVDGVAKATVGYDFPVGTAPLGHGIATLPLANLRPSDRVVVRVRGSSAPLRLLFKTDVTDDVHEIGFWSGGYFALLWVVAFFIIVAVWVLRDPTMVWFLAFTLLLIVSEMARDSMLPLTEAGEVNTLLACGATSIVVVLGFFVSYLRLHVDAPRLFAVMVGWALVLLAGTAVFVLATHRSVDSETFVTPFTAGLIVCLVVAEIRRRSGYLPATFISIGFLGLTVVFVARIVRDLLGASWPFIDRWEFELGAAFDVLAFAVAVTIRSRYSLRERVCAQNELAWATYEADHDQLTGLLNRRGLEVRFTEISMLASTVLFVDLDGFKAINDRGGHAAGDDALKIVSRILRHAVRPVDVVARIGGDEFVVILVDVRAAPAVAAIATRISAAVAAVRPIGGGDPTRFGASIGRVIAEPGQPLSAVLAAADADAYRIKAEHYAASRNLRRRDDPDAAEALP
jgi:diguanylate cyclase (GGDEF)-like protein